MAVWWCPRRSRPRGRQQRSPLLPVVDRRGPVREWDALRRAGHWSEVATLCSAATPVDRARPALVAGADRLDLARALAVLGERGWCGWTAVAR